VDACAQVQILGRTAMVKAQGDFDLATVHVLSDAVQKACATGQDVLVDVAEVAFMDCCSFHCLAEADRMLRLRERSLRVFHVRPIVRRLAAATGFEYLLLPGETVGLCAHHSAEFEPFPSEPAVGQHVSRPGRA
jgi:anti-anti-sigma factor